MDFLQALGIDQYISGNHSLVSFSPTDGKRIGAVEETDETSYNAAIQKAAKAFEIWRNWPAPKRGEIVRQVGEALRTYKEPLGKLVSYARVYKKAMAKCKK
jgi:aldehyde dehydrogenase (NAD+)